MSPKFPQNSLILEDYIDRLVRRSRILRVKYWKISSNQHVKNQRASLSQKLLFKILKKAMSVAASPCVEACFAQIP